MKTLNRLQDLRGKTVFVRVDFNVPVENGIILDDFRIKKILPTIDFLRQKGASVVLASHFENTKDDSLKVVWRYLQTFFPVKFAEDIQSQRTREIIDSLEDTEVVLLENLRKWKGEKANDPKFAEHLASLADIYVNEAFSASHREHASIVGVSKHIPAYAGLVFASEVAYLQNVFNPEKPFVFILGGAKFSTKLPLLKKFLAKADHVIVAGALMNTFFAHKGFDMADSLVEEGDFEIGALLENKHLYLPSDVIVQTKDGHSETKTPDALSSGDIIMDVGPQTVEDLQRYVTEAKFIVWNGPLGNYEKGYAEGTKELAHRIAQSGKDSIIGGGDTISVVSKLSLLEKFTFVSTGGGAMLDFLSSETLPGIKALD